MLPNFLIIGAAKSGTTALYHYLKQHPEIYMSPLKEAEFFAFENEILDFHGPGDMPRKSVTHLEAYQTLFEGVTEEQVVGEASPVYLYHPKAPDRIHHYLPDAKLIAILRDPIERAYSQFVMFIRDGREPLMDFAQAVAQEDYRMQQQWAWGWHYTRTSFYYTQLQRYFDKFSPSQIKVYLYEDLEANTTQFTQDVFRFLGVDDTFCPKTSVKHNISGVPQNALMHTFLVKKNPVKEILKPLFPKQMRKQWTENLKNRNLVKPSLEPEVRQQLIPVFRDEILQLQDLIQRDLSHWLV